MLHVLTNRFGRRLHITITIPRKFNYRREIRLIRFSPARASGPSCVHVNIYSDETRTLRVFYTYPTVQQCNNIIIMISVAYKIIYILPYVRTPGCVCRRVYILHREYNIKYIAVYY